MKRILANVVLLTFLFSLNLRASDADSLMHNGVSFSNNNEIDKAVTAQLKKINKALKVKTNFKTDGVNSVEWLDNTHCSIKREIEYTSKCGKVSTAIELVFASKTAINTDNTGPAVAYLANQKTMKLEKTALYQPRCENGITSPNSYNLKWFNNKGELTQLP